MAVTGADSAGNLLRHPGTGEDSGLKRIHCAHPEEPGGVAARSVLAAEFAEGGFLASMFGGDGFRDGLWEHVESWISTVHTYPEVSSSPACFPGGGSTPGHPSRSIRAEVMVREPRRGFQG